MSRRFVGTILSLVVSLAIGIGASQIYYSLFSGAVPDALRATTSMRGTWLMFTLWGLGLGLVVFAWSLAAAWLSRFFTGASRTPARPPTP